MIFQDLYIKHEFILCICLTLWTLFMFFFLPFVSHTNFIIDKTLTIKRTLIIKRITFFRKVFFFRLFFHLLTFWNQKHEALWLSKFEFKMYVIYHMYIECIQFVLYDCWIEINWIKLNLELQKVGLHSRKIYLNLGLPKGCH